MGWAASSMAVVLPVASCAGCTGSSGAMPPIFPNQPITAPGTYTITLTGTAVGGGTAALNLNVWVI